ncbi:uncharacterized protein LOC123682624 isoform X2 [Harmonia axyridis]|uniref:uncharacterized protein LOC123682624 isoform X2 n=1 Tax=Harmonia axyridis TaxID=115357 RepID=UPI001E2765FC|nr:uncharacterized protein LOC123682624 isoform X2 [Harmonia axyridis]
MPLRRLPVQKLPFKDDNNLSFLTLVKLGGLRDFKVPISLKGEEIHLLLCDKEKVEEANCYWFILQGWSRRYTAMRKCKVGGILPWNLYPKRDDCVKRKVEKVHSKKFPLYSSKEKWSHIMIEKKANTISLKLYNERKEEDIIDYTEKDAKMFELNYILGHRKDEEVLCKVHENNYMRSTTVSEFTLNRAFFTGSESCISFILNTCSYCSTTVIFLNEGKTEVILEKNFPPTNGIWEHHKSVTNISSSIFFWVKLKTMLTEGSSSTGSEFWSFDDFRVCHNEEYRITQKGSSDDISECQLLEDNKKVEKGETIDSVTDDIICSSPDAIGSSCISCDLFQERINNKKCEKLQICEEKNGNTQCFCSSGYMGSQCNKVCPKGPYGYFCQKQCAFCDPVGQCDAINGKCDCHNLFEGPTCQVPKKGQYLEIAPKVVDRKADSCEIQWDSENYIGKTKPKYYLVQYSNARSLWWNDYGEVENLEKNGNVVVGNFESNKQYAIRVLLSDEKSEIKKLHYMNLPAAICITTCNDWIEDDIVIKTTSFRVEIHLNLTRDKCPLSSYQYSIEDQNKTISNGSALIDLSRGNLSPFENYSVTFKSKTQTITKEFRTKEGVPSEVDDIKMNESTPNSMKIHWKQPDFPNGNIVGYKVTYKKVRGIACKKNIPEILQTESEMNTTINNIELTSLEPYSEYQVKIYAFNEVKVGKGAEVSLQTEGIDHFDDSEDFKQVKITDETVEKLANFKFEKIKCQMLLGALNYRVKFRCISEWCLKTEERNETSTFLIGTLVLGSLQAYCKYKSEIYFCRNEECKLKEERMFETKPSVPNKLKEIIVIATGDAFIWVRWLPPYPPTGEIFNYKITSVYSSSFKTYEGMSTVYPQNCEIWPEYHCSKISGTGIYYGIKTALEIEATNKEKFKYVNIGRVNDILVQETASEPPYNVFVNWNNFTSIEVFWNHPNRTNGILQYFQILITSNDGSFKENYTPHKWKLTYSFKIAKVPAAEDFTIKIVAVNNMYEGYPAVLKDSSYPPSPELDNSTIFVTNYTKTTVSIALYTSQTEVSYSSNVEKYVLIIIDDQASETTDPNLVKLEQIVNTTLESKSRLRIVAALDVKKNSSNILNFTIGNGNEIKNNSILNVDIVNKPLKEAEYYNVFIVMLNKYRTKYRHSIYNITTLTLGDPTITPPPTNSGKTIEEDDSSGGNALYALFLLLLLIPIIVGIIIKRKIKTIIRHRSLQPEIIDTSHENPTSTEDRYYENIPLDPNVNQRLSTEKTNENKYDYIAMDNMADIAGGRSLDSKEENLYEEPVEPPMGIAKKPVMNLPLKLSTEKTNEDKYDYIAVDNMADIGGGKSLDSKEENLYEEPVKPPMGIAKKPVMNLPLKLSQDHGFSLGHHQTDAD